MLVAPKPDSPMLALLMFSTTELCVGVGPCVVAWLTAFLASAVQMPVTTPSCDSIFRLCKISLDSKMFIWKKFYPGVLTILFLHLYST